MKNIYRISYLDNPFQVIPDFKPEYLQSEEFLPYIKSGKLVFSDNHIKIEGRKILMKFFNLLMLILPLVLIVTIWIGHLEFNFLNFFIVIILGLFLIAFLVADIIFLIKSFKKEEELAINIKDIEFLKIHEIVAGPFKIKWNVLNFKAANKDYWVLPTGFMGNKKEVEEIISNFRKRGLNPK
jgi:hypothetical protein